MKRARYATLLPWLLLALVILIAAALRIYRLDVLPPGLFGDEAINGVDERFVLGGNGLPIYYAANNGREPLFLYLQAVSVAILGATPLALRIVSAVIGILTVPAIYFCARTILRPSANDSLPTDDRAWRETWPALIAAAGAAVSYWALSLSRLGLRAVMLPLISAIAMAFFWRAWRDGRRRDYALAGLWLGISLYTYTSARLLPVVPLAFIFAQAAIMAWHRARGRRTGEADEFWRSRLAGLALAAGVFALVLVPLALAVIRDPAILAGRTGQVSILGSANGSPLPKLVENLAAVARNFYDRGDINLRQNLPGRPANDVLLAILFTVGLLAALWRIQRPQNQLILVWFVVMLVPTLLSTGAPHALRAAGAVPPLCLLYGIGGGTLIDLAGKTKVRRYLAPALVVAVLLVSGGLTARDYFYRWAILPKLGAAFNLEQQLAADAIADLLAGDEPGAGVLIPYQLYAHPQVTYALGAPAQAPLPDWAAAGSQRREIHYVLGEHFDRAEPMYLLWRQDGRLMEAGVDPLSTDGAAALAAAAEEQAPGKAVFAGSVAPGWARVQAGVLPADVHLEPRRVAVPLNVAFADGMRLVGYNVEPDWVPGSSEPAELRLSLFWQIGRQQERGILAPEVFVHLANAAGVWQTKNGPLTNYLMPWLKTPYTMEDIRLVPVPADMPAGKANFEVGLYLPSSSDQPGARDRIDIVDDAGKHVADRVDLGTVMIGQAPDRADQSGLREIDARFEPGIRLTGWSVTPDASDPDVLKVDLGWQTLGRSPADYTAFVHLVDTAGNIVAQRDGPPGGPDNPTSRWVPGETVRSSFILQVPPGTQANELKLRTGLYEPVSGKQLPVHMESSSTPGIEGHGTYLILPAVN